MPSSALRMLAAALAAALVGACTTVKTTQSGAVGVDRS